MTTTNPFEIPDFDFTKEFSDLQIFQFIDKYAKFDYELGRRETWRESITRSVEFLMELSDYKLPYSIYQDIFTMMYRGEVSPSLRLFSTAGNYARKNNAAIYNCCFLPIDCITAIAEILWLSISGCGIGFSVEKHNIEKLPVVEPEIYTKIAYLIPDTSEGWYHSTYAVLCAAFDGSEYDFDYSQIRASGTPIKTKGGYASGPEILQEIHNDIYKWIRNAAGRQLTSLEVHDICTRLADAGISGGVRRAAMISFFDEDNQEMLSCKNGNFWETAPWRSNANNSVILLEEQYTKDRLAEIMVNLWENGSGEPGIIFPRNLQKRAPKWREFEFGLSQTRTNPCQPGFATILTPNGIKTFDDIDIGSTIWSEDGWVTVTNKICNGKKEVIKYTTTYGEFVGTSEHKIVSNGKKIEAQSAKSFDALRGGLAINAIEELSMEYIDEIFYGKKLDKILSDNNLYEIHVYLRGVFDKYGSVFDGKPQIIIVKSYKLVNTVQLLLSAIGIRSFFFAAGDVFTLRITTDTEMFSKIIGFSDEEIQQRIVSNADNVLVTGEILSTEYLGKYDVYDITVSGKSHTYWTGGLNVSNCGEITLEGTPVEVRGGGGEFCNLSAVICKPDDTLESLVQKTIIATIIGDIQSLATNFPILRPVWGEKCRNDRLLGVNHVGHANCAAIRDPKNQKILKDAIYDTDVWFADFMHVSPSASMISSKPSGNTSTLYAVGPGSNPIHGQYSIRNVVVNTNTAMYNFLLMQGVPQIEYSNNTNKAIFSFPYAAPENSIILSNTTALEQCEYWKQITLNLMDHNASCSITYHPDEIEGLKTWIYENQDIIGGQAFFPSFDANYPYLPIFIVDKKTYQKAVENFPKINWNNFHLYEHAHQESFAPLECSGERCDISY